MIKKLAISLFSLFIFASGLKAQHGISFYTLGNATFQSTSFNPALFPAGKVFIGLPGISGVNAFVSSPASFNELVTTDESGQRIYNISNVVNNATANTFVGVHSNIDLFHFGISLNKLGAFSLFANARTETDINLPKEALEWFWKGNALNPGGTADFSRVGLTSNTFYEIGLGYANAAKDGKLRYGARLKYYGGLMNISTQANFSAKILTEAQNYQLNAEIQNGFIRTSGLETVRGAGGDLVTYLTGNSNRGAGLDLGIDYQLSEWYSVQLAVTDLGFINWQTDIRNHLIQGDTSLRYVGVELKGLRDLSEAVNDSLVEKFERSEFTEAYTTLMPSRALGSFTWYTPYFGLDVISSVGMRMIQAQPKMMYGVGVRKRLGPKLILAATANKLPQQFFNVGASLSATAGIAQFYVSTDRTIGYSAPDMKWMEVRVGLNLVFGSGKKKVNDEFASYGSSGSMEMGAISKNKGVTTTTFMGRRVDAKRTEGIYTVIPKQQQSEGRTITPDLDVQGERRGTPASASGRDQRLFDKSKPAIRTDSDRSNEGPRRGPPASVTGREQRLFNKSAPPVRSVSGRNQQQGFFERIFGGGKKSPASVTGQQNKKGFFEKLFGGGKKRPASASGRRDFGKKKTYNQRSAKPKFKKPKRKGGG